MHNNMHYRAVSNLDADGCNPAFADGRSRIAVFRHADVRTFASIGEATAWLLRAGGGGIVYVNADDSVASVIQPGHREFRAVTTDAREEYFASSKIAREWLRSSGSGGWIEQYDSAVARFTPIHKEAA